jgi:hypothetical protein
MNYTVLNLNFPSLRFLKNTLYFFLILYLPVYSNAKQAIDDTVKVKGNFLVKLDCTTNLLQSSSWTSNGTGWSSGSNLVASNAPSGSFVFSNINPPLQFDKTYKINFTVSGYSSGILSVVFGGNYMDVSSNGVFEGYFTFLGENRIIFSSLWGQQNALNATITNFSLCEIENSNARVDGSLSVGGGLALNSGMIKVPQGKFLSMGFKNYENITYGQTWLTEGVNMAFGHFSGEKNTTGRLTAFGYGAGSKNTDGVLTAFGQCAGQANTTGHSSFFGNYTGIRNTTSDSHCFGDEACAHTTSGNQTGMGYYALHNAVSDGNSAFGHNSLRFLTTGNGDGFGWGSLYHLTTGDGTAFGESAGHNATTARVTAFGRQSARNVLGGSILAIGWLAGGRNDGTDPVSDTNGMLIGDNSGRSVPSSTILTNYAAIGPSAVINESNAMVFGNSGIEKNVFYGKLGLNAYPNSLFRASTNENTNDGFIIDNTSTGTQAALRYTAKVGPNEVSLIQHSSNHNIWPSTAILTSVTENTNGLVINQQGNKRIRFINNDSTRLSVAQNGNIAIGHLDSHVPTEKLEINGNLNTNGFQRFSKTFPSSGLGVTNGSIFKGSDGGFYYKTENGSINSFGINSVSNVSINNSLSTTVNGATGNPVPIINTVENSILDGELTTTINGVSSTSIELPTSNGSETKINNGSNTTIMGTGTMANPYLISVSDATTSEKGVLKLTGDFSGTSNSPQIAINAITSSKILDQTIAASDIADNAITISKLPTGATPTTFLRGDGTWEVPSSVSYGGSATIALNGTTFERAALTGDVNAGVNSNVTTISDGAITSSKILDQTIAAIDIADNAVTISKLPTGATPTTFLRGDGTWEVPSSVSYGGSTTITLNGTAFERAALTGDVSADANSNVTTISDGAITSSKILDQTIVANDIADNAITISKLPTGATPTTFLRGDGTWEVPSIVSYGGSATITLNGTTFERAALTGDVSADANSNVTTISNGVITSSKILDQTIAAIDIADHAISISKLPLGATSTTFLRGDGTWVAPQNYNGSSTITLNGNSFERAALIGDVSADANSNLTFISDGAITSSKISNNTVTFNKMQILNAKTLMGNPANISSSPSQIFLGTGLSFTGSTMNTVNNGTVTNVTGTLPISVSSGTSTPIISVASANPSTTGVLESADWNTFNNKIGIVTATSPSVVSTSGTTATINNNSANWNANQLQGNNIVNTAPLNGQILAWDASLNAWKPTSSTAILVDANRTSTYNLTVGTSYDTIIYNNAAINEGSVYNSTTGIFTAPSEGLYQVIVSNMFSFTSTIPTVSSLRVRIVINGNTTNLETAGFGYFGDGITGSNNINCNTIVMMNTNDTLRIDAGDVTGVVSPQISNGQHNLKIIRLR